MRLFKLNPGCLSTRPFCMQRKNRRKYEYERRILYLSVKFTLMTVNIFYIRENKPQPQTNQPINQPPTNQPPTNQPTNQILNVGLCQAMVNILIEDQPKTNQPPTPNQPTCYRPTANQPTNRILNVGQCQEGDQYAY